MPNRRHHLRQRGCFRLCCTNGRSEYVVGTVERGTFQEPKHYYRPIPAAEKALNSNLEQVFGWD
ncbi:hypothetical protein [Flagellimonas baculiformis]|uniref:hypothetical protein n=1 Tax=Flagellimonas baculiformis TaxID=3067310 RepID=UPI00296FC2E7|nr:hypothetical protein [Muricauda sp. D6]